MSRGRTVAILVVVLAILVCSSDLEAKRRKKRRHSPKRAPIAAANFDTKLPVLGTRLAAFPAGSGKSVADGACLACHSADMVCQQRLSEKQWTAEVGKMVGWGAPVSPEKRTELIDYLVRNFGPDNDRFQPMITRPVGR